MVTGLWYTHDPNSCSLSWFCRWKEHPCPLSPDFGLWRMLEAPEWGLASSLDLDMVGGLWYTHNLNVVPLSWFWSSKEYLSPLSTDLVLLRMMEVPDYGLVFWTKLGYGFWSLIDPHSEFWLSLLILKVKRTTMSFKFWSLALEDAGGSWLILKVQRTSMSLKSWFRALEDTGGSWRGFYILIMTWK